MKLVLKGLKSQQVDDSFNKILHTGLLYIFKFVTVFFFCLFLKGFSAHFFNYFLRNLFQWQLLTCVPAASLLEFKFLNFVGKVRVDFHLKWCCWLRPVFLLKMNSVTDVFPKLINYILKVCFFEQK